MSTPENPRPAKVAKNQPSTNDKGDHAKDVGSENNQKPAKEMDQGADESNIQAGGGGTPDVRPNRELNALELFTGRLALFTGVLAAATIVLAGATIGVWIATTALTSETKGIKTATEKLATATDRLVDYAKAQTEDMKGAIEAAKNSADAAKSMAESARDNTDILRAQLGIEKSGAVAHIDVPNVEIGRINTWTTSTIEARIQIKNNGRTAANDVQIASKISIASPGANPCRADASSRLPATIGPNGDYPAYARIGALKPEQVSGIIDGRLAIFVYGRINYVDVSKTKRFKNFRLKWQGSGSSPSDTVLQMNHTEGCNDGN